MTVFLKRMLIKTNKHVEESNIFARKNRVRCSVNYLTVNYYRHNDIFPAIAIMFNDYGEKSCVINAYFQETLIDQVFVTPHADIQFFMLEYEEAIKRIIAKIESPQSQCNVTRA